MNEINNKFIELYSELNNLYKNVKIFYYGPINDNIFLTIEKQIREIKEKYPRTGKKLQKIYIELFQNLLQYSLEKQLALNKKEIAYGSLIITETENQYKLITANHAEIEKIETLVQKCNYINSLDRKSLRQYKIKQRTSAETTTDNANIGLIQVILTTSNPICVNVQEINNKISFLSLTATINKL